MNTNRCDFTCSSADPLDATAQEIVQNDARLTQQNHVPNAPHNAEPKGTAVTMPTIRESAPSLVRTPKGMRMNIGLFGRRNVGKSSVLNAITNQEISIVSDVAGTTTDPVDKPMELLPLGPVLFVDTAGIDDEQDTIGTLRTQRTARVFDRCDVGVVVTEAGTWGTFEDEIVAQLQQRAIPFIIVFNKIDAFDEVNHEIDIIELDTLAYCRTFLPNPLQNVPGVCMCALNKVGVADLRQALLDIAPQEFIDDPTIVADLVPQGSTVIMVIPIDKEAPKGRIILPQVQVLRDLLDAGCCAYAVRETELAQALKNLAEPPALVITDSQVFKQVAEIVPETIPLTGFSVAFARFKGDLVTQAKGARVIDTLTPQSRVLIAEACTHHPIEEDIGTVKIPALLRKRVGAGLTIDNVRGVDFPDAEELKQYDLVIHCGACTFNRRMMLTRIHACLAAGVPITNYGLTLAYCNGIFERSIQAFPGVAEAL